MEHHAHLVHPDITVIFRERAHFKKGANNVRGDGSKKNRVQQHATGACQVCTRKTTIASIARSTQHPPTPEETSRASHAETVTNQQEVPQSVSRVQQENKFLVHGNLASAPFAPSAKSVQRPEQTAPTAPLESTPTTNKQNALDVQQEDGTI